MCVDMSKTHTSVDKYGMELHRENSWQCEDTSKKCQQANINHYQLMKAFHCCTVDMRLGHSGLSYKAA